MVWNVSILAFLILFITSALLAMLKKRGNEKDKKPLEDYLLANKSLKQPAVVSLLLSTSFGVNIILYQGWLGYTVGVWGIIIQFAWAVSFILLSRYTNEIRKYRSIHEMLGNKFGINTRKIAGIFTLVGFMYLIGWESAIGKSALESLSIAKGADPQQAHSSANFLTILVVFGCLFYTVLGGLRGNANADILLNVLKLIALSSITFILLKITFFNNSNISFSSHFFPSIDTLRKKLGWLGLITNVFFSLTWQFVDNSTWQNIIAGNDKEEDQGVKKAKSNLYWSSIAVFAIPGIIGTLFGISLAGVSTTQENFFSAAFIHSGLYNSPIILFCFFITIMGCVMSMLDGLFLASSYTLIIDIFHPEKTLAQLDRNIPKAETTLLLVRLTLIGIGVVAIWGVQYLLSFFGKSLFDFVYIVIITQLALIGPVFIALSTGRVARFGLWLPMSFALLVGFCCAILGSQFDVPQLADSAGVITILTSIIGAIIATKKTLQRS